MQTIQNEQFSELYTIGIKLERLAGQLRERNKQGGRPLKSHVASLYDLSYKVISLNRRRGRQPPKRS